MMTLHKIFENDDLILYEDNKGYDFVFDIENKNDFDITIKLLDYEEEFTIKDWCGLFDSDRYIIEAIINGNYEIKKEVLDNE